MKKFAFIIFSTITFYCNSQEKIILTTGDTLIGKVRELDELRSRIKKTDGTSVLIPTNMIKSINRIPLEKKDSVVSKTKLRVSFSLLGELNYSNEFILFYRNNLQ